MPSVSWARLLPYSNHRDRPLVYRITWSLLAIRPMFRVSRTEPVKMELGIYRYPSCQKGMVLSDMGRMLSPAAMKQM